MARLLKPFFPLLLRSSSSSSSSPAGRSILSAAGTFFSAFDDNLIRLLRNEISYHVDYNAPSSLPHRFKSFSIEDRPGEQWIRLRSKYGAEDVKVEATMFDGAATLPPESAPYGKRYEALERGPRLHISLIVEVSRPEAPDSVCAILCSAWPEYLDVEMMFPLRRRKAAVRPYMGRNFKDLEKEVQYQVAKYLVERGVDDELAEFLHFYMANKDKAELLRWLRAVESFVQK